MPSWTSVGGSSSRALRSAPAVSSPFSGSSSRRWSALSSTAVARRSLRIINRRLDDFAAHRVDVRAFARTETLHESLDAYRQKITAGARPVSAAYELAAAPGRGLGPGDQISYYVTRPRARVPGNQRAKPARPWGPARPRAKNGHSPAQGRGVRGALR